jgi:hypothetical protein
MKDQYGQPPRTKPRLCFGHAYFYATSGNIALQFRSGEIYVMPNAGLTLWTLLAAAVKKGEFYNFNVRHVFHAGGKTFRQWEIPPGFTDSF